MKVSKEERKPIEVKCVECGVVSIPKWQLEKNDQGNYTYSDGCLEKHVVLCDECMSKGWTDDPQEVFDALNKDTRFQLGIKSPYE